MTDIQATGTHIAVRTKHERIKEAELGAYANNTHRAYEADLKVFTEWLEQNGSAEDGAATLVSFLKDMSQTKAPATLSRYLVSIRKELKLQDKPDVTQDKEVVLTMRGIRREKGTAQKQAKGLTANILHELSSKLTDSPVDLRDIALLRLARDTLARRSELTAFNMDDFEQDEDGRSFVLIRRGKTDQEGEGTIQFVSRHTMEAIDAYTKAVGIKDGPLFRRFYKGGKLGERLDANRIPSIFKRLAQLVGVDPSNISGHSTRVGMAQDLMRDGAALPALMHVGRWKTSRMPARYTEQQAAGNSAVAQYYGK